MNPGLIFYFANDRAHVFLKPLIIMHGDQQRVLGAMESIHILATSLPDFEKWLEEVDLQEVSSIDEYREMIGRLISSFPDAIKPGIIRGLEHVDGEKPSRIVIHGPSATLEIDAINKNVKWLEFDYAVLQYISLIEAGENTVAIYIGRRPYGLYDAGRLDTIRRSLVGVTGYLISYMLGPFFILRYGSILIKQIGDRPVIRPEIGLLLEKNGASRGRDWFDSLMKLVGEARRNGWRIPFLLAYDEDASRKIVEHYRDLYGVFTHVVVHLSRDLGVDPGIPRAFTTVTSI